MKLEYLLIIFSALILSCSKKNEAEKEKHQLKFSNLTISKIHKENHKLVAELTDSSKYINPIINGQIREFKIVFFSGCIGLSSKNKCVGQFLSQDVSTTSDYGLGFENYRLIDSLVEVRVQRIYEDSIRRTNQKCKDCDSETLERMINNGMIGKQTLGFCLDYYSSNELDSIARANVKLFKW